MLSLPAYFPGRTVASLTIRKLDDAIKAALRLRAARNGRSVEDEVRVILRETSSHPGVTEPQDLPRAPGRRRAVVGAEPRITLIIGGGIAAYKALDLIR